VLGEADCRHDYVRAIGRSEHVGKMRDIPTPRSPVDTNLCGRRKSSTFGCYRALWLKEDGTFLSQALQSDFAQVYEATLFGEPELRTIVKRVSRGTTTSCAPSRQPTMTSASLLPTRAKAAGRPRPTRAPCRLPNADQFHSIHRSLKAWSTPLETSVFASRLRGPICGRPRPTLPASSKAIHIPARKFRVRAGGRARAAQCVHQTRTEAAHHLEANHCTMTAMPTEPSVGEGRDVSSACNFFTRPIEDCATSSRRTAVCALTAHSFAWSLSVARVSHSPELSTAHRLHSAREPCSCANCDSLSLR